MATGPSFFDLVLDDAASLGSRLLVTMTMRQVLWVGVCPLAAEAAWTCGSGSAADEEDVMEIPRERLEEHGRSANCPHAQLLAPEFAVANSSWALHLQPTGIVAQVPASAPCQVDLHPR